MRIWIDSNYCISCGACVVLCPCHAIHLEGGSAKVDPDSCTGCLRCLPKCYRRAIHAEQGAMKTASEITKEILTRE